jgi:hypothetical protein
VPPGVAAEQVALGKKIFHGEVAGGTRAGCHGAEGIGTPVGALILRVVLGSGETEAFKNHRHHQERRTAAEVAS